MTEDELAEVAAQLAARVREEPADEVAKWFNDAVPDPVDRYRLHFVQAAATPVDVPWLELTSWAHGLSAYAPAVPEAPPFDAVALERARSGDHTYLPPRAKRVVVEQLSRQGLTAREIGDRLGLSHRQVQRIRDEDRAAAENEDCHPCIEPSRDFVERIAS